MDAAVGSSVYRGCVGSYWGDQAVPWPDSQRIAVEVETTALIVTEGKNTGVQLLGGVVPRAADRGGLRQRFVRAGLIHE